MNYFVYIATNKNNNVLYTGVTNNLERRAYEHRNKLFKNSFTSKYNIYKIVYYEQTNDIYSAISREKHLKRGTRKIKIKLINNFNHEWKDLADTF